MTRTTLSSAAAALCLLALPVFAQEERPSCVTHCHGAESTAFANAVHAPTMGCTGCHGGDPTAQRDEQKAHAASAGFQGKFSRTQIVELCGGCHSDPERMHAYNLPTDQLAQYRASTHGKALFEKGDPSVAVCTDCHGSHGILPAHDSRAPTARVHQPETCGKCHSDAARMAPYGLDAGIVVRFRDDVHGRALLVERTRGAPSCADCHGAHGAAPPGVDSVPQVCGQCHRSTAEAYLRGPHHAKGEVSCATCHEEKGTAYRASGCTACHSAHDVALPGEWMYTGDEVGHCGHCHRKPEEIDAARHAILDGRHRLQEAMRETRREISEAKHLGLFLENEDIYLLESQRALVSLQPRTHSFDTAAISEHLQDGIGRQERTRETLAKKRNVLRDRRLLLGVLAGLLLLLASLFAAKLGAIRRLS